MARSIRAIRLLCVAIGVIAMFAGNAYSISINGSTIDVSGLGSTTKAVTVTLHNFSATKPSDVDLVVVGPTGAALVLMGGAAGTSQVGPVSVTFDDTASNNLISTSLINGTFKPTQVGPIGSFPSPGPGLAYHSPAPAGTAILGNASAAGVFGGTTASTANPNGTWSLYAMDKISGDSTDIAGGWSVNIQLNAPGGPSTFTNLSPIVVPAPPNPGDFNNDHHVNAADIQPAMTALTEPGGYELQYGITAADLQTIGDVNHDGKFNNADLQSLLNLLKSGGGSNNAVPEPSTFVLAVLAFGLAFRRRLAQAAYAGGGYFGNSCRLAAISDNERPVLSATSWSLDVRSNINSVSPHLYRFQGGMLRILRCAKTAVEEMPKRFAIFRIGNRTK